MPVQQNSSPQTATPTQAGTATVNVDPSTQHYDTAAGNRYSNYMSGATTSGPAWASGADPNYYNTSGNTPGSIADQAINSGTGTITNAQQAAAFIDPNAAANQAAIQGGMNQQLQGYGPGGSSLAGVTHLGNVANAGTAQIATGQSNNILGGQLQNINQLNAQAQGQGPSLAQQQAQQQSQANIAANMATIGSQRGSANSALGLRQAGEAAAQANQQSVQAGVMGRTAEEMNAQQQLAGALGQTQGQVQQGAQAQAQLGQQASLQNAQAANAMTSQQGQMNQATTMANLQASLQAGQINMDQYNAMLTAQLQQSNNAFTAQQNYAQLATNSDLTNQAEQMHLGQSISSQNQQMGSAIIGGGAALAGAGLAASDARLKTGIKSASRSMKDFLSQISAGTPTSGFALMGES